MFEWLRRGSRRTLIGGDRIVVTTGTYPPDVCGVGDYTSRLMSAAPDGWQLLIERNWSVRATPGILRRLMKLHPSHLIIQYPTQGYGWSLVPHFLVLFGWVTRSYRSVLALHEFTSLSAKARLSLALVSHFASHIVFTTESERDQSHAHWPFSPAAPTSVIGILSNIPSLNSPPNFCGRRIQIAYFGHIRPNKGIEEFLQVIAKVKQTDPAAVVAVIGEVPQGYEAFASKVETQCRKIGCELEIGLDDRAVAAVLANVCILYLPFPDGVSARRGSVLAGLGNGAIIATRVGQATPANLLPAIIPCSGSSDDAAILLEALRMTDKEAQMLREAGRSYMDVMLPRDWAHMVQLYERAIQGSKS